jgi:hypothetical protein
VAAGIERASLGANAANKDYFASAYLTGPLFGAQMPNFLNSEQVEIIERLATRSCHRFGTGRLLLAPSLTAWAHTAFPELKADRPYHRPGDDSRP